MSKKPESVTIHVMGNAIKIQLSKIDTFLSLYDDINAMSFLDSIPPVQRAWVYRELGA